jgi:hypothetical protein
VARPLVSATLACTLSFSALLLSSALAATFAKTFAKTIACVGKRASAKYWCLANANDTYAGRSCGTLHL